MDRSYPFSEIAKRLHEGRLILFVGAGMSMPFLPSWGGLLREICDQFFPAATDPDRPELDSLFENKQYLAIAWAIQRKTGGKWREWVAEERFQRKPVNDQQRRELQQVLDKHESLRDLPFASVVTTNFDRYLDPVVDMLPVLHNKADEVVKLLRTPRLLKLHGDITDAGSLIFTAEDFRTMKLERPELVFTMEAAARLYSFLFVGYSMQDEDVLGWLERVCHVSRGERGRHFALISPKDWGRHRREQYKQLYDIQMVDAELDADGRPDIVGFFGELREEWRQLATAPVVEEVKKWEDDAAWPPEEAELYVDPAVMPGKRSLDRVFDDWLADDHKRALVVLGEFGMGKTWFCLRAREKVREWKKREPRLVQLGRFQQGAGEKEIAGAFGPGFLEANAQGKLVLILDAFDEMGRKPGETLQQSFDRLQPLTQGKAKVVITCRSELFAHEIKADWAERLDVAFFDKPRIAKALELRGRPDILRWIEGDEGLTDLASRPLLLDLLLEWPKNESHPSLNKLYENAVVNVLKRGEKSIDPNRLEFARSLAWKVQQTDKRTIDADTVDALATAMVGEPDPLKVLRYKTRALLVRRGSEEYEFGHLSFQEYLVADQVREHLAAGRFVECRLSDPIIRFIREKWTMPPQEPVEQDGMVWIPPGPFIFGQGKEACVENLEKGFWMDKYPVTNAEFARFLDSGVKIEKAWFKDEKKIRDKGFAKHPVVKVSWHGAKAYAAWAQKQLPTNEQWEKAARGMDGREYPWGDGFDAGLCNTTESGKGATRPVDAYPDGASPYGCLDMAGNVWEWSEDDGVLVGNSLRADSFFQMFLLRPLRRPLLQSSGESLQLYFGFRCSRASS